MRARADEFMKLSSTGKSFDYVFRVDQAAPQFSKAVNEVRIVLER